MAIAILVLYINMTISTLMYYINIAFVILSVRCRYICYLLLNHEVFLSFT